jgi:hypothetical protein
MSLMLQALMKRLECLWALSIAESGFKAVKEAPPVPVQTYLSIHAVNVSFVPDMFRMNCPGISFSMCMMAFLPVQCVGTT